ncbi:MAG: ABC transporter substrate-binding protein [Deltaproteobacteria bacterium]|jgi:phospholipid transport system substrate-binding protein|nr:ABC transporter substrate-binding protein [Deltaproteobacteria bacterium]
MRKLLPVLLLLGLFFASAAVFSNTAMADAATEKSAARLTLEKSLDEVIAILESPDFKNPAKNAPLMQAVKDKIYGICDFQEFSARTIGGRWRAFTPEQQQAFTEAFAELLFETYNSKLLAYDGQQFNFLGETVSSKGDKVEIRTTIPYDGKEAAVNYRMIQKDSGWKIYDMIIENIGMVQNYRNQFQDILSTKTPEDLIASIRDKAKETREKNNAAQ